MPWNPSPMQRRSTYERLTDYEQAHIRCMFQQELGSVVEAQNNS